MSARLSQWRRGAAPLAALIAIALLLGACQTLPPPQRANLQQEMILPVPFFAQEKYQCGPAALAMMLAWAGHEAPLEQLVDEVWLPERQGTLAMELNGAVRSRGLLPYPINDPDALFTELQHGRPVLVMQNLALPRFPQWHFAVVSGYQDNGKQIVLHSDTRRYTRMHWNRFVRTWARADLWGFTLVSPGELPASADPDTLFKSITPLRNSAEYWPHAVAAFPDSGLLWFAYGNSLWSQGEQQAGLHAFQQATRLSPEFAAAWYNQGQAETAQGNPGASRKALCKARALAPTDRQIQVDTEKLECKGENGS